ncbi:hypothetical protein PENTCL1PPCAC_28979, partial [Pristionchus entomophagus]
SFITRPLTDMQRSSRKRSAGVWPRHPVTRPQPMQQDQLAAGDSAAAETFADIAVSSTPIHGPPVSLLLDIPATDATAA